jgi:hypothetical protein
MKPNSRREFLSEVGQGMLVASLGTSLANHLGVSTAFAAEDDPRLSFGKLEPLVGLMQETPTAKILPALVGKLNAGVSLRQLVAAGALANARTFGGENYHGFHTFMALAPAYDMAKEMPKGQEALPVLKVLYRNSIYTEKNGGHAKDVLKPVKAAKGTALDKAAQQLRAATNATDKAKAERLLAALAEQSLESAFNGVLHHVEDNHNVHTIVMPWRAWDVLELTGKEHALTLLRQSVRQCAGHNSRGTNRAVEQRRAFIPKLLDEYKLLSRPAGKRKADDAWVEKFALNILTLNSNQAAEAAAAALAEGILPEHVGEAISLAANQLILRQVEVWEGYGRRTHGDSRGVHASDMINAWRNIARVCSHRHAVTGLIIAAQNVSNSHSRPRGDKLLGHRQKPFPQAAQLERVKAATPKALLRELDGAIRENNQLRACALVHRYGELGHAQRPLLNVLIQFGTSEDGRLHAEKYYHTATEEFTTLRKTFRWRQMVSLARVTASCFGFTVDDKRGKDSGHRAPGYEEARRLLKV